MAPLKNCYDHLPNRKGIHSLTEVSAAGFALWDSDLVHSSSILSWWQS
jgi:hypothetical protein